MTSVEIAQRAGEAVDPVIIAAVTALVKVMTTDAWSSAKGAVVGWWHKHHLDESEQIGTDLDRLHSEAADADQQMQADLQGEWRLRLRRLLKDHPELGAELKRLVDEELTPLLSEHDRTAVAAITQTATVSGNNNVTIQAGRDAHVPPTS